MGGKNGKVWAGCEAGVTGALAACSLCGSLLRDVGIGAGVWLSAPGLWSGRGFLGGQTGHG